MTTIVDRRLNPRDKTLRNRKKFIERSREQIKRAVKKSIDEVNIADIEKEKVRVRVRENDEPVFRKDPKTGDKRYILPGNKDHIVGDKQKKPSSESGAGGSSGGLGTSEDDFEFILSKDEFLDFIFDDFELPDLVKKQMKDVTKLKPKRAGYTNVGNPSQLDVIKSLKNSIGRRIGLRRPKNEEIAALEQALETAKEINDEEQILWLEHQISELKRRQLTIPWLDPFDVRYRNFVQTPEPMTQAVMFCVLDVSGSMTENLKDLAKRFFFFLHMFLHRKYNRVDIVFVKHHEQAFEVDEEDFFYSRESGGTVVSGAINLVHKIIADRYNVSDWNIYVAQCSDGDNFSHDYHPTIEALTKLLPLTQYYAYVEVKSLINLFSMTKETDIWKTYKTLTETNKQLHMKEVYDTKDIWKVFKELFGKDHQK